MVDPADEIVKTLSRTTFRFAQTVSVLCFILLVIPFLADRVEGWIDEILDGGVALLETGMEVSN